MKLNLERYTPVGFPWKTEWNIFLLSLGLAVGYSVGILFRYMDALEALYTYDEFGRKLLLEDAVIVPFSTLIQRGFWGFYLLILLSAVAAILHYIYHSQGSKSIYLMRRLPDSKELPKRCLTLPCIVLFICVLSIFLLRLIYFGVYYFCAPKACLSPIYLSETWTFILGLR